MSVVGGQPKVHENSSQKEAKQIERISLIYDYYQLAEDINAWFNQGK